MKLRIKRNRRNRTTTITFKAENDKEGVDLKDALLASVKQTGTLDSRVVADVLDELEKRGYSEGPKD